MLENFLTSKWNTFRRGVGVKKYFQEGVGVKKYFQEGGRVKKETTVDHFA